MNTTRIFVVAAIIAAALMIGQTAVMTVQQALASGITVTNGGTIGGRCDDCAGNAQNQENVQNSQRHR